MEGLQLFLENNEDIPFTRANVVNGAFIYRLQNKEVDDHSLYAMIAFSNTILKKYSDIKLPIVFDLGDAYFADKLTYILFECMCACLIEDYGYSVQVNFSQRSAIHTAGVRTSPLLVLNSHQGETGEAFSQAFASGLRNGRHFRKLLTRDQICETDELCKMFAQIVRFQEMFGVDIDCREQVAEVIVELIGNAGEHGKSDCLVDFDVAPNYSKRGCEGEYAGINIAVVNFSRILLGSSLKDKMLSSVMSDERYGTVSAALENHRHFFNEEYDEDDFFNITAFQHKISGRSDSMLVGGTGLTKLIESLERRADAHTCYVVSGDRKIWFQSELLKYDDGWIGFNTKNDYVKAPPDIEVLDRNCFVIPGTAYNLNFVMKVERMG